MISSTSSSDGAPNQILSDEFASRDARWLFQHEDLSIRALGGRDQLWDYEMTSWFGTRSQSNRTPNGH